MTPNLRSKIERRKGKKFLIFRIVDFGLSHSRLLCSSRPRLLIQENSLLTMFDQHPSRFAINQPSGAWSIRGGGAFGSMVWETNYATCFGRCNSFRDTTTTKEKQQKFRRRPQRKFSPHPPPEKAAKLRTIFYCRLLLLPRPSRRECFCLLLIYLTVQTPYSLEIL